MSEPGALPLFVREALEGADDIGALGGATPGSGNTPGGSPPRGAGRAGSTLAVEAPEVELSLLALERALDDARGAFTAAEPATPASVVRAAESAADRAIEPGLDFRRALTRLKHAVNEPGQRYAPFFGRVAELFDLSEDEVAAQLARLHEPGVWAFAGLPGIAHVAVSAGPRVSSAETLFVRFRPGVYFPRHDHTGLERVLVLEGSYRDSHGVEHRPGELREWAPGTEHSFKVADGETCIFASVVFGRRFGAWPLRALAALLGR